MSAQKPANVYFAKQNFEKNENTEEQRRSPDDFLTLAVLESKLLECLFNDTL